MALGSMLEVIQTNWIWINNIRLLGQVENRYNHWELVRIRCDVVDMLARKKIMLSHDEQQATWKQACDILRFEKAKVQTKWVCHAIGDVLFNEYYYLSLDGTFEQVIRIKALDAWQTSFKMDTISMLDAKVNTYTLDMYDDLILYDD